MLERKLSADLSTETWENVLCEKTDWAGVVKFQQIQELHQGKIYRLALYEEDEVTATWQETFMLFPIQRRLLSARVFVVLNRDGTELETRLNIRSKKE